MAKQNKMFRIKFLAPAVIMFCIVFVYPLFRTIAMSFFSVENITGELKYWHPVGIGNYIKLMNTTVFVQCLKNILTIWFFGGLIVLTLALIFAGLLNSGIKLKSTFRSIIYMPYTIATVALALMWLEYAYNTQFGLLKTIFTFLHLNSLAAIQWTDPAHRFLSMFIAYCFGCVGYHMVIFSSGIESIPGDYYDAAKIDGCGKVKEFIHITWPMIRGVLKTNLTMWSIACAGFYTWSMMFGGDGQVEASTRTPVAYLYVKLFGGSFAVTERDAGLAAAVGVITGIFILTCFVLINVFVKDDDLEY